MILAVTIGLLVACGVYLITQRGMVRIVFGMMLISHAANLILLATGVPAWRSEPIMSATDAERAADPLPQAFVLTAIVITLAVALFMLTLAALGDTDDTAAKPAPLGRGRLDTRGRGRLRRDENADYVPPVTGFEMEVAADADAGRVYDADANLQSDHEDTSDPDAGAKEYRP